MICRFKWFDGLLLAETHVADLTPAFEQPSAAATPTDWLLLVPIAMAATAWLIYRWCVAPTATPGEAELLVAELCKTHGLSAKVREFLLQVSRAAESPHPAAMFLSQSHFDEAINAAEKKIRWNKDQAAMLQQVRRTIT